MRSPERFHWKPFAVRKTHEVPVLGHKIEQSLKQRAEWMVAEAKIAEYLAPKIRYRDRLAGEVERGVTVLSVGSGKGHEMNEMDALLPGSRIIGLDPHDHWSKPMQEEMGNMAHDVVYLPEEVSAERLAGMEDHSVDGVTFFFVLHHMTDRDYVAAMSEVRRVLKDDGYLFVAEDLVDSEAERKRAERVDRRLNLEVDKVSPHNYQSKSAWEVFFREQGFRLVEAHENDELVRKGFFVYQKEIESQV